MNILENLKSYFDENRQLILASILSAVVIVAVIITLSFIKNGNNKRHHDHYLYSTTTEKSQKESSLETTPAEQETSELSDLNFTLPQEVEEETETTLKDSDYEYMIKVNRAANCVTIYRKDKDGKFTIPHKAMACSTGKNINYTPTGTFRTSTKHNWRLMVDNTYSQYATRIYNGILFHSIPCTSPSSSQMEYEEFNKLGSPASLGCVRLTVADAKWIYDNCSYGTIVEIYDDKNNPGPLGKPSVITIPANSPYKTWDPTDPDPNNPWHKCEPSIEASDITIKLGKDLNLLSTIKATDTCGNDITSSVKISGSVNKNKEGTYKITYSVTDLLGKSANISISVTVKANAGENVTTSPKKRSASSNTTAATVSQVNTMDPRETGARSTTAPYVTTQPQTTTPQVTTMQPATNPPASTARPTQRPTAAKPTTLPPPVTTRQVTTTPVQITDPVTEPLTTQQQPTPAESTTEETVTEPQSTAPPEPTAPSIDDDDYGEQETTAGY